MTDLLSPSLPKLSHLCALALFLVVWQPAMADIHRCVDGTGKVEYSDTPCAKGVRGKVLDARPNVIDSGLNREQVLRSENQNLRERLQGQAAPVSAAPTPPAAEPARIDGVACRTARRDYEVSASSIANTKAYVQAKESAMYGICGLKEPDRQITKVVVPEEPVRYLALPTKPAASRPGS